MKLAEFINNQTRSISMYHGVMLGLIGIWLSALVFSFVGWLGFGPLALVASTAVLVGSVWAASVVSGWLFGIKPHAVSSIIAGLIMTLIFTPTLEMSQLIVLAFAGLIAGVSKFVVTWSGRHIFNPAAFGAVVVGLAGLGSASWWVATPVLTPIVLVVVLMGLYQSKRWLVPGVFLAITVPVLMVQFLLFGASAPEALFLLLSWPLLFLAGIMLTEPLTLPPRRWQMYTVAAVVAIAFLLPIKIGVVQMSPALALLVGNLLAAIFARRSAITLAFKGRRALTPTTDELTFTSPGPLVFTPGQYIEITVPHKKADFRGIRRSFSITSLPGSNELAIAVKFPQPSSSFKKALKTMQPGIEIRATTMAGDFTLPKDPRRPLLFVAGGVGITPFVGHLASLQKAKQKRDIVLVYAMSDVSELAYRDELEAAGVKVIIVAPDCPKNMAKNWYYSKGSRINFDELTQQINNIEARTAYVSGPVPFVQHTSRELRKLGVRGIKHDYFTGY